MNNPDEYNMDKLDHDTVNEAADWFLGTLKPRTAGEVRSTLIQLYLKGLLRGIHHTKEILEDVTRELGRG